MKREWTKSVFVTKSEYAVRKNLFLLKKLVKILPEKSHDQSDVGTSKRRCSIDCQKRRQNNGNKNNCKRFPM